MKLIKVKCENCGADLEVNKELNECVCNYCGAKTIIDDETKKVEITKNINYKKMYTDEAKLKKIENEEKENKRTFAFLIIYLLGMVILLIVIFLSFKPKSDEIALPVNEKDYRGRPYEQVVKDLESIGFENVETYPKKDITIELFTKDGQVESVTINGKANFEKGEYMKKNARVLVTYHSKK